MSGFRLGRIYGIDVHVHGSWVIIALLVLWSLTSTALPADFPDIPAALRLVMGVGITILFFVSLLAHELAHSVVAVTRGIPVHRITFFLFGGMAQTASDSRSAGEEFIIAIAGPVMSFLLGGLFGGLWYVGSTAGWPGIITGSAGYVGALNLILAIFNLLPGFPMDGGRVLRAILWKTSGSVTRATRWASRVGVVMALLLMAYGFFEVLTGRVISGLWIVFIALFIRYAARSSYRHHLMTRLQGMAQQTWVGRYHRHPFGPGPRRGSDVEGRPGRPGEGGEPGPGRDVTHLSGNEA
jgi:Zn-dependent protease